MLVSFKEELGYEIIACLDANCKAKVAEKHVKKGAADEKLFTEYFKKIGLRSCWEVNPQPDFTANKTRSYIQAQWKKAYKADM